MHFCRTGCYTTLNSVPVRNVSKPRNNSAYLSTRLLMDCLIFVGSIARPSNLVDRYRDYITRLYLKLSLFSRYLRALSR